jgi:hypothetical protein
MACLERFGLANCNGNYKPITSRLTVKEQPAAVNTELYRGMVGSLTFPKRLVSVSGCVGRVGSHREDL